MPAHHDVRPKDVFARRLHATLAAAAEQGPVDFADLLLSPGVGARTVQSLAMVAEVLHGAPFPFRDPARFSLAHGGKDRHRDTDIPVCARRETKETPWGRASTVVRPGRNDMKKAWFKAIRVGIHTCEILS